MNDHPNNGEGHPVHENNKEPVDLTKKEASGREEQQFDKSLDASHSVHEWTELEVGWCRRLPVTMNAGTMFPGETVPMMVPNLHDDSLLSKAIREDKLFGVLCTDETGSIVSGYGVVCEVFDVGAVDFSFMGRARHRCRLVQMPDPPYPRWKPWEPRRWRFAEVRVLPELRPVAPLHLARLASLDRLRPTDRTRHAGTPVARRLRGMDAALTPWPQFVHDLLDYRHICDLLQHYFTSITLARLPDEPASLSFWVASNLMLPARDRLALFMVDNALLRLHMLLRFITRKSILCCKSCAVEIARREDIFPMFNEGVHCNYPNRDFYPHGMVTVSRATNIQSFGRPSVEISRFPNHARTAIVCAACTANVGFRFDSLNRSLQPQRFFALYRHLVKPRTESGVEPDLL